MILATNNEVVERSLYKGNSTSEKLFELVARLRTTQIKIATKLLVTHISGKRMMAQGTDGVSSGIVKEGVALGETVIKFCPWGRSAIETLRKFKGMYEVTVPTKYAFS